MNALKGKNYNMFLLLRIKKKITIKDLKIIMYRYSSLVLSLTCKFFRDVFKFVSMWCIDVK